MPAVGESVFIAACQAAARRINECAHKKGWYHKPRKVGEFIALMHSELSEGLEAYRNGNVRSDHIPEFLGMEEELADVIIRILDFAKHKHYRVAEAVIAKMRFNETRPYRHGGKKL